MKHRTFKQNFRGITAVLCLMAMPIGASAAVSSGPKYTNSVAGEQHRNTEFYRAEQSYQEKLKVGRERYERKQENRAKIIAAMQAQLASRQQTIVIPPGAAPGNADEPVSWFTPLLILVVVAPGFLGSLAYYLTRSKLNTPAAMPPGKTAFARYTLD